LIFGDLRHHAGRIAEANRCRSPVLSSTRLSTEPARATAVDPRRDHLDRAGRGQHLPRPGVPVAHDKAATALVQLVDVCRDVRGDLSRQRRSEHPPRPITHDLIDQRPARCGHRRNRWRGVIRVDYGEHGRILPTRVGSRALLETFIAYPWKGTPPKVIHRFQALPDLSDNGRHAPGDHRCGART
jgi:hypothetical protein